MTGRVAQLGRAGAVGSVLLVLLAIVALASRGDRASGAGPSVGSGWLVELSSWAFTLGVVVYGVLAATIVVMLFRDRGLGQASGRPSNMLLTLLLFIVLAGLLWIAIVRIRIPPPPEPPETPAAAEIGATRQVPPPAEGGREGAGAFEFRWPLAVGVAGLVAASAAFFVIRRRLRPRPEGLPEVGVAASVVSLLEETMLDLREDGEPRRVVIAAYVQLEQVLAGRGLPRRPSEAPFEYLGRVLRALAVRPAAALALTELFERARFSTHEIDEAMRSEALAALAAVRDDLRREEEEVAA